MNQANIVKISVVMPIYNERDNIYQCITRVKSALEGLTHSYEIICIDDGSNDGGTEVLCELAKADSNLKIIQFRKNYGQTAAIAAGFNFAQGDIVLTLDADLQNNPEDIHKLINSIKKGYDVVCGWRRNRKDKLISRRIPSYIANRIISLITGVRLHDYGCTLRAYRRKFIKEIKIYGEMHRFLPALLSWVGADIVEVDVGHAPRRHGKSKYGILRTYKVILDLITVKLLTSYSTKPIYMFGGLGLLLFFLGTILFFIVAYRTFILGNPAATPLIFIMVILFISGVQMILSGLLAEINIRTFFETKNKQIYNIRKKLNL
jgi:glycosyltransferase involved in cell wall biosynthesis